MQHTRRNAQGGALAGSVRADERDHFAGVHGQRQVVKDRGDVAGAHVAELESTHRRYSRRSRRSSQRKNGPPTNAVKMPTGISVGGSIERASKSASTRKAAPSSAAAGRSRP